MQNWTYIMENFIAWSTQGYTNVVGFFFWPIMFSAVIGYIYIKQQSVVAAAVATIILFGAFATSGVFAGVEIIVQFFQIMVALAFTGLVLLFVARRKP